MFARNKFLLISVLAVAVTVALGSRYAQESTEPSWVAAPVAAQEPLLETQGLTCRRCRANFDLQIAGCANIPGPARSICLRAACCAYNRCIDLVDGEICPLVAIFRRGDPTMDGRFNLSDPIQVLGCLFLGTECSSCPDAADSDDNGSLNIADATYLLTWRFIGGTQPPPPFPGCGADTTEDSLPDCVFDAEICN